ncbi:hypothetical protein [Streptomyces sp. NPDC006552]|uniref:hypothetical protein n=1 Tax=Streptomyces sp. NPDC006552 TaxID=3157179 RepID=UPI0033B64077
MNDMSPPSQVVPEAPAARKKRRLLAAVATCAVVLAVAGGTGFTVLTVDAADRTVPTTVWGEPEQQKQRAGGVAGKEGDLAGRLLPMPKGYVPGPDIDEFGNDEAITGPEVAARFKKSADDLPARQREDQRKAIDKLKPTGLAMRSYASGDTTRSWVSDTTKYTVVEVQLARVENRRAGRALKEFRTDLLRAFGTFAKGPAVKGHKDADCFLAPRTGGTKLDMLLCSAYEDDLLVTMTAYAPRAIDGRSVATLMAAQLDHIASRGESV